MAEITLFYKGPIVTRAEAKADGRKRYFTGKRCPSGHVSEQFTSNACCVACVRIATTPEGKRASIRRWNEKHPEKKLEYHRRWISKNRAHISEYWRLYRLLNLGRIRANDRIRRKTDSGKIAQIVKRHLRRARKEMLSGAHTAKDIEKLLKRCTHCYLCKKRFTAKRPPTLDHVIAVSHELGTNDPSNLALACGKCNSRKRNRRINPKSGQGILL